MENKQFIIDSLLKQGYEISYVGDDYINLFKKERKIIYYFVAHYLVCNEIIEKVSTLNDIEKFEKRCDENEQKRQKNIT